jgi:thiol:disulfide interchange protein DsbD
MRSDARPGEAKKIRAALLSGVLSVALPFSVLHSAGAPISAQTGEEEPLRRVELLVVAERPGGVTLGLHIVLAPGWYLYWLNPGDAGLAPEVSWELPPGFGAGPLRFPAPQKIVHGDIVTYGFFDETLILCDIRRPEIPTAAERPRVGAGLSWMACRESCITGKAAAQVSFSGPVAGLVRQAQPVFSRFAAQYPRTAAPAGLPSLEARLFKTPGKWSLVIALSGPAAARVSDFFPYPVEDFVIDHHGIALSGDKITVPLEPSSVGAALGSLGGLLIVDRTAFEVSVPVKE